MPLKLKIVAVVGLCGIGLMLAGLALTVGIWGGIPLGMVTAFLLLALVGYQLYKFFPWFDPFGSSIYKGPKQNQLAALTFDDGPSIWTEKILDVLRQENVRATFFFLGENAKKHPGIVRRTLLEGHCIGNHGFGHRKMHRLCAKEIESELIETEKILAPLTCHHGRKLLRVPHGFRSLTLIKQAYRLGYLLVGWTSGVWDSARPGSEVIVRRSVRALRSGCILLLHDGDGVEDNPDRSQTLKALPAIIRKARAKGIGLVTLKHLLDSGRPR